LSLIYLTAFAADYDFHQLITVEGASGIHTGNSIDVSGDFMVVGAVAENSYAGAAYIFQKQAGEWVEINHLFRAGGETNESFGAAVAISGSEILVSCRWKDGLIGVVYAYHWDGASWTGPVAIVNPDPEASDQFGYTLAMDGDYAVIGAIGDNSFQGSAYVYHLESGVWTLQKEIFASEPAEGDAFGNTAMISGDYLAVSSVNIKTPYNQCGAVYLYHREGTDWVFMQMIQAYDAEASDFFGVVMSMSGDYLAVTSTGDDDMGDSSGSVYIYHFNGTDWLFEDKVNSIGEVEWDCFGSSLHVIGNQMTAGATYAGHDGVYPGAVYVFQRSGAEWIQTLRLEAPDGVDSDGFGETVFYDGTDFFVGAPYRNSGDGAVYRFTPPTTLPVEFSAFTATQNARNEACLSWTVQSETDLAGYNVFRAATKDIAQATKINYSRVSASNQTDAHSYEYIDTEAQMNSTYCYWIESVGMDNTTQYYGPATITLAPGESGETPEVVLPTSLGAAYPNPFNPSTLIAFHIAESTSVTIEVFDLRGRLVKTLLSRKTMTPGEHGIEWNGCNQDGTPMSSGVYSYRMTYDKGQAVKTMTLLK
jgi:hypothetical protein